MMWGAGDLPAPHLVILGMTFPSPLPPSPATQGIPRLLGRGLQRLRCHMGGAGICNLLGARHPYLLLSSFPSSVLAQYTLSPF